MALTGFGQMPIYKRYYMSDIPGFDWLADINVTRTIHYLGAALLLTLMVYAGLDFLLLKRKRLKLTGAGYLRILTMAGIVFSGIFIVIKNFPYIHFSDGFIIGINLSHIGAVMALLFTNLAGLIYKKRWTVPS
jgi:uncharacterized membrane protein (UPF0182 family)